MARLTSSFGRRWRRAWGASVMVSRRKVHWSLYAPHQMMLWFGRVFALLVMLAIGGVSVGLWWMQQVHPRSNPVDLGSWAPRIQQWFGDGASLSVGRLEMYYERGLVLRG